LKNTLEDGKISHAWSTMIGRNNIVKMAILPKAMYTLNAIPNKIPMTFIRNIEKSTLIFIWKQKIT
jgi:hypothetical protein